MSVGRLCRGFALAPLPVIGLLVLIVVARAPADFHYFPEFVEFVFLSGYVPELLIGLPVHLILRISRRQSLAAYIAATAFAILLPFVLVLTFDDLFSGGMAERNPHGLTRMMWSREGIVGLLYFVGTACVTAALFWRMAIRDLAVATNNELRDTFS